MTLLKHVQSANTPDNQVQTVLQDQMLRTHPSLLFIGLPRCYEITTSVSAGKRPAVS